MLSQFALLEDVTFNTGNAFTLSAGLVGCWVVWKIAKRVFDVYRSPLRKLPGPPSDSFIFGNFLRIITGETQKTFLEWEQTYGHVFAVNAVLGVCDVPSYCNLY
jgi:hypothetical protein